MEEVVQATQEPTTNEQQTEGVSEEAQAAKVAEEKEQLKLLGADMDDHIVEMLIDGQPQKLKLAELKKLTSLEKASQKRLQEAAEIKKKTQGLFEKWTKDPNEYFKAAGMDPVKFAEEQLKRAIEEAEMSPEQKKAREEKAQLDAKQKEIEQWYIQRAEEEVETGIVEAFQKTGLPKSPFLMSKIAAVVAQSMDRQNNNDGEPLSYEEAAVRVKTWFQNSIQETLKSLPEDQMVNFLGPELVGKLKKHFVAQVSNAPATTKSPVKTASAINQVTKPKEKRVFKSTKEFQDYIDSL